MSEIRERASEEDREDDRVEGPVRAQADLTLGGYLKEHNRPPAFEGVNGEPYTVSAEVEQTPNLLAPYEGYLVFPRWAATGLGVVGHLETATLERGISREAVLGELAKTPLWRVKELLDQMIREAHTRSHEDPC